MEAGRSDLELHVATTADSRGLKKAADDLDETTGSSDKLGESFKDTGKESERTEFRLKELGRESGKLGESIKKTSKDSRHLDEEIKRLEGHIRELGQEFDRTGNRDVFKSIRKDRGELANLRRIKAELANLVPKGGLSFGGAGLTDALPMLATVLAPAIPPLAMALGGALAGAIGGTTVGAGMAAGILTAAHDPEVVAAAHAFGQNISNEFFGSTGSAFVEPIKNSLHILEDAFKDMNIGGAFAKAAPAVETVAQGLGDMGRNIMPGLNAALDRSGEFSAIFADGLADTGSALSEMITDMVESKGAAEGLRGLFVLLNGTIRGVGESVAWLSDGFHQYTRFAANATGALEDFWPAQVLTLGMMDDWNNNMEQMAGTSDRSMGVFNRNTVEASIAARQASDALGYLGDSATFAAGEIIKLDSVIGKQLKHFQDYQGALANAEQAIDDMAQSMKDNGTTMDIHTQQGRDNQRALQGVADAAAKAAQARYDDTGSLAEAQEVYDEFRQELIKTLIAAGKTKKEAQALADAWLAIPGHVSTVIETTYVTRKISPDQYKEDLKSGARHQKRAAGGPVAAGMPYTVGEHGTETFVPARSGMILPHGMSMMGGGGSGGQWVARPVQIPSGGFEGAFWSWFRNQVQAMGGTLAVIGIRN